jgi:hypothetical protein
VVKSINMHSKEGFQAKLTKSALNRSHTQVECTFPDVINIRSSPSTSRPHSNVEKNVQIPVTANTQKRHLGTSPEIISESVRIGFVVHGRQRLLLLSQTTKETSDVFRLFEVLHFKRHIGTFP